MKVIFLLLLLILLQYFSQKYYKSSEGLEVASPSAPGSPPEGGIGSPAWEKMSDEEGKKMAGLAIKAQKTGAVRVANTEEIALREKAQADMIKQQEHAEKLVQEAQNEAGEKTNELMKGIQGLGDEEAPKGAGSEVADCAQCKEQLKKLYNVISCEKRCSLIYNNDFGYNCKDDKCHCKLNDNNTTQIHGTCEFDKPALPKGAA